MAEYLRRSPRRKKRRLWWKLLLLLPVLIAAGAWSGEIWLGRKVESLLNDELGKRGLVLQHGLKTWDPWRGLNLNHVMLHDRNTGALVAELDNVGVSFPLGQVFGRGEKVSYWKISNSAVKLCDEDGEVDLDAVTMLLAAKAGDLEIQSFAVRKDGLVGNVHGHILLAQGSPAGPPAPFHLKLRAVRGTIAALKVKRDTGPLRVTGEFNVDTRGGGLPEWTANLHGEGGTMEWQGIPLLGAKADAELTGGDSKITADLVLPHGGSSFTLSRADWKEAPFVFSGHVKDSQSREDGFSGSYQISPRRLVLDDVKGPADLQALAGDIPFVAPHLPEQVSFSAFPLIDLKHLSWEREGETSLWEIGPLTCQGSGRVKTKHGEVTLTDLSGSANYDGKNWTLRNTRARVFGGDLAVSGRCGGSSLLSARIHGDGLKVSDLKRWMDGEAENSKGLLTVDYRGDVDTDGPELEGSGTMRLENAPVFDAPLLEQTYQLFDAIFTGVQKVRTGEFQAAFTGKDHLIEVNSFEARGGTLTVNAKGTINLKTKRVEGTARGKLTGLKGVVTSPLSHLLEMNVSGPFDDIRVKPQGPVKLASKAANGTVGAATDTVKEAGKITGTVIVEGVKLPFRIFGGIGRRDDGDEDRH